MGRKKRWLGMLVGAVLATTGCCRVCDRWCPDRHGAGVAGYQAAAVPCVPCVPTTAVGAAPVAPVAGGWNAPGGAATGYCVPCVPVNR